MYPFQFDMLWQLGEYGPLTAAELAARPGRPLQQGAVQVAGSLRPLVQRGFVAPAKKQGAANIYGLTEKGREYIDA
jgi:chromosome segregation and condensation protein ScpB